MSLGVWHLEGINGVLRESLVVMSLTAVTKCPAKVRKGAISDGWAATATKA